METFKLSDYQSFMDLIDYVTSEIAKPGSKYKDEPIEIFLDVPGEHCLTRELCIENGNDVWLHGLGAERTIITVNKDFEFNTAIHGGDDAMIYFNGTADHWVSVEISDLTVKTLITENDLADIPYYYTYHYTDKYGQSQEEKTAKGYNIGSFIFKSRFVKSYYMHDVKTMVENVVLTAISLRGCANVKIVNNDFTCYNRRLAGGIIWFNGEVHGAVIKGNRFRKFGNDELLAFLTTNKNGSKDPIVIVKENILIEDNVFIIEKNGSHVSCHCDEGVFDVDWEDESIDLPLMVETDIEDAPDIVNAETAVVRNVRITRNRFQFDHLTKSVMALRFCSGTTVENVMVDHNTIEFSPWISHGSYLTDFKISYGSNGDNDELNGSYCGDPIQICHNQIISHCLVTSEKKSSTYSENHIFISLGGQAVRGVGNEIVIDNESLLSRTASSNKPHVPYGADGIKLLYTDSDKAIVNAWLEDNYVQGVQYVGVFVNNVAGKKIAMAKVRLTGNTLRGNTRIYQKNVDESHLEITDNRLICTKGSFLLGAFAREGNVVFERNIVERDVTAGVSMLSLYSQDVIGFVPSQLSLVCANNVFVNETKTHLISGLPTSCTFYSLGNRYQDNGTD